jgi:hypothetical protein
MAQRRMLRQRNRRIGEEMGQLNTVAESPRSDVAVPIERELEELELMTTGAPGPRA